MTEEAMAYLTVALNYIEQHSVRREICEWPALRKQVTSMAEAAQTTADTYPAIRYALEHLDDHHSFFLDPEGVQRLKAGQSAWVGFTLAYPERRIAVVYPGSPAEQGGLHIGDRVEAINGHLFSTLTREQARGLLRDVPLTLTLTPAAGGELREVRLEADTYEVKRQPRGRRLAHDLGYLEVPDLIGLEVNGKPYAARAHQVMRELDQTPVRGWVLDLRTNTGGSLWPMLAGVGPILGEGENAGFAAPGEKMVGSYRAGRAWIEDHEKFSAEVEHPYTLKRSWPPVAVLTSQLTASAGEFVLLAFLGRPHTRTFGVPTMGVPTANDDTELSDGAWIFLTTHLGADRTDRTYDGPILPDAPVTIDWTRLGTDDDPVLQAAVQWLHREADVGAAG
jgi:C-terminal processing protease CtpA/Prc